MRTGFKTGTAGCVSNLMGKNVENFHLKPAKKNDLPAYSSKSGFSSSNPSVPHSFFALLLGLLPSILNTGFVSLFLSKEVLVGSSISLLGLLCLLFLIIYPVILIYVNDHSVQIKECAPGVDLRRMTKLLHEASAMRLAIWILSNPARNITNANDSANLYKASYMGKNVGNIIISFYKTGILKCVFNSWFSGSVCRFLRLSPGKPVCKKNHQKEVQSSFCQ